MSRIRTIKPDWWTREEVLECSPIARLLYLGINNFADDKGNIEGHPRSLKAMVFPADEIPVESLLWELYQNGLIQPYEGKKGEKTKTYLNITTFSEDQRIDRPSSPRCPVFESSMIIPWPFQDYSQNTGNEASTNDRGGKGREGKVKDRIIKSSCSDWDLAFAQMMIDQIGNLLPNHNFQGATAEKWGNVLRLMRETDKLNEKEIEAVWTWAHTDSFWQSNILSPAKLREKFSQLKLKMKSQPAAKPPPGQAYDGITPAPEDEPMDHNELVEHIKKQFVWAEEYLDDPDQSPPNDIWLRNVIGKFVLEYSERWPKGPFMRQFEQKLDAITSRVLDPL